MHYILRLCVALACLWAATAPAEEAAVEAILSQLSAPCGVAVRPTNSTDRYEIFIADSGAGRVIRIWSTEPNAIAEVITGFERTSLGEGGLPVGPIAVYFLDANHLVVGVSGANRTASLRLYELVGETSVQPADSAKQVVELDNPNATGNRAPDHIYALARTVANDKVADALIFTAFANDQSGDLQKIAVRANMLGTIQLFVAGENAPPAAVVVGPQGTVVASWVGSLKNKADSRLAVYNPLDSSQVMNLATGLHDILGLAYSTKNDNLYAADAAWAEPTTGGVFRIDDTSQPGEAKCRAVKIARLPRPSALAFGPDGTLYVTTFGDFDGDKPAGKLYRITGDL